MTASDAWSWLKEAPAERLSLPAAGGFWAAAEIVHAASLSGVDISLGAAALAGVTFGATHMHSHRRKLGDEGAAELADTGRKAAITLAAAGGWLALAARYGVLAGPYCGLTDVYLAATALGYRKLRRHQPVARAREWRQAKRDWLGRSGTYGLGSSHLMGYERTRIGEWFDVDVRETGRRASHFAIGDLAERIAEIHSLPASRVKVSRGRLAGRVEISIRYKDPWKEVVPHPVLDPETDFELPVPCSIMEPIPVGYDPESWAPVHLELYDKIGTKNILLTAMKGGGKTTLLNCIRERVTAAEDAILVDINLSKALEDLEWSPACDMTAIGDDARRKARDILAVLYEIILWRPLHGGRETSKFRPDRKHPLVVLVVDEIDTLTESGQPFAYVIKTLLAKITSKNRSEGVSLVIAGQRATAQWLGGADIRANIDTVCIGKVNRRGEANHAGGELGMALPSMIEYGEGHAGVWGIAGTDSPEVQLGRTFALTEPLDIREIAYGRRNSQPLLERKLVAHLGDAYQALRADRGEDDAPLDAERAEPEIYTVETAGGHSPVAVLERTDMDDPEPAERRLHDVTAGEFDAYMPPEMAARFAELDQKLAGIGQQAADLDAIELPKVAPEKIRAAAEERWAGLVAETELPKADEIRVIAAIRAAGPGGISGRQLAVALEMDRQRNLVGVWARKLIADGKIRREGEKRGARLLVNDLEDGSP